VCVCLCVRAYALEIGQHGLYTINRPPRRTGTIERAELTKGRLALNAILTF
jgi:hypothetical protein